MGSGDASRNASAGPQRVGLEVEPQSQLNLTRSSHAERSAQSVEDLAEGREDLATPIHTPKPIRLVEVWMIKQVEHLRTEFEVLAFRDARLFENGEVDLMVGRSIERIAP